MKDGASERVVEKSSYEVMSENPFVDIVKDEPDMRRLWFDPGSKFSVSFSTCCPEYLRSITGIASSDVKAWPMLRSPSKFAMSRPSSHAFDVQCSIPRGQYVLTSPFERKTYCSQQQRSGGKSLGALRPASTSYHLALASRS